MPSLLQAGKAFEENSYQAIRQLQISNISWGRL